MEMHDPPHPGEVLREICLAPLGLSITAAAKWLGVSRQSLSELVNGRNGVSAEMAIRLEQAFGGSADTWLRMQIAYDLWQAKNRGEKIRVNRYPTPQSA
ncbi:MAG: HigA family addiction module antidote protein [Methylocystis sp.]|nr:HigA family addiction module antidote protein [Methylocystis sp.]